MTKAYSVRPEVMPILESSVYQYKPSRFPFSSCCVAEIIAFRMVSTNIFENLLCPECRAEKIEKFLLDWFSRIVTIQRKLFRDAAAPAERNGENLRYRYFERFFATPAESTLH